MKNERSVLVTGDCGFIGFHVARQLLDRGAIVHGIDNMCHSYYSPALKQTRKDILEKYSNYTHYNMDLSNERLLDELHKMLETIDVVVHLAAQACVPYSFDHSFDYIRDNIVVFQNMLEIYRRFELENFIYASSSSVYGHNPTRMPTSEASPTGQPVSPYGVTKVSNEMMAEIYYSNYQRSLIGLRFFKVYGPWARPDTVFFKFVHNISQGLPIEIRNHGDICHSFTYIDDVLSGIMAAIERPRTPAVTAEPHPRYNLGNPDTVPLSRCVEIIENKLAIKAQCEYKSLPEGDRSYSCADISRAEKELQFKIATPIESGIEQFITWYRDVYVPSTSIHRESVEQQQCMEPPLQ